MRTRRQGYCREVTWVALHRFGIVGPVQGIHSIRGALRVLIVAGLLSGVSHAAEAPIKGSAEFFDQFCGECHYEDQSGGLDLSVLTFDPTNRDNFATWVRVLDRVAAGEMPPKKRIKNRPGPADLSTFTHTVSATLTDTEKQFTARDGRAMQRRLNRYEYENALRDLLNVPW